VTSSYLSFDCIKKNSSGSLVFFDGAGAVAVSCGVISVSPSPPSDASL
jgi:hypothetical protein